MKNLIMLPSKTLPAVSFLPAEYHLYVAGLGLSPDLGSLARLQNWFHEFLATGPAYIHFEFEMEYYNNVFALFIHDLFRQARNYQAQNPCSIAVVWKYDRTDDFIELEGRDFAEIYPFVFRFISRPPFGRKR
jgi:hypothetical protein